VTTARNDLTAHSTGSHRGIGATSSPGRFSLALEKRPGDEVGIGGGIQIPERLLQSLLPFLTPPPESPGRLARRQPRSQGSLLPAGNGVGSQATIKSMEVIIVANS